MTGKELIIYILNNNLLDKPVYENGRFNIFTTLEETAFEHGVGFATTEAILSLKGKQIVKLGNQKYIL